MTKLFESLSKSNTILFLTGAGVSTDSGIPDFASTDSTWEYSRSREELMSIFFFQKNPQKFWEIYRKVFNEKASNKNPNTFHNFLAKLEEKHTVYVATQNVDGLHVKAGSSNVYEMHGTLDYAICARPSCQEKVPTQEIKNDTFPKCPKCRKPLKPNISLFGEGIQYFGEVRDLLDEIDIMIVAGTRLNVGPVNELPIYAHSRFNKKVFWINNENPADDYEEFFADKYIGNLKDFVKDYENFLKGK